MHLSNIIVIIVVYSVYESDLSLILRLIRIYFFTQSQNRKYDSRDSREHKSYLPIIQSHVNVLTKYYKIGTVDSYDLILHMKMTNDQYKRKTN